MSKCQIIDVYPTLEGWWHLDILYPSAELEEWLLGNQPDIWATMEFKDHQEKSWYTSFVLIKDPNLFMRFKLTWFEPQVFIHPPKRNLKPLTAKHHLCSLDPDACFFENSSDFRLPFPEWPS